MTIEHQATISVAIDIDGQRLAVPAGTSVAAALALRRFPGCTRLSVTGAPRAPACGMGICQECRVSIDGRRWLACQTVCATGMQIRTGLAGNEP